MSSAPQRIRQDWSILDTLHRILDGLCIVGSLFVAMHNTGVEPGENPLLGASVAAVVFFFLAEISGVYRNWRGVTADREYHCILATWTYTVILLVPVGYLGGYLHSTPRRLFVLWAFIVPVMILAARMAVRATQRLMRARGFNTRRFAVVGVNDLGIQLARNVEQNAELGLRLVGFYDDRSELRTPELPAEFGRKLGKIDDLVGQARRGEIDIVYITFPMRAEDRIRKVLARLADTTASVYIVPDFFVFELLHSRWTNIGGLPAVSVYEHPFYGIDGAIKRATDLVLGGLALAVFALPMLAIAAAIKITSPGPVFFRQKRYGLDGREIRVWKFRSMRVMEDGGSVKQAIKGDSRITPLGAVLRKTSLDELPQLFNVLEGTMSLVGPRPHASAHNEEYRNLIQGYMLRHKVKPGITGLAQVNGWRGETETLDKMAKRVEFDHRYIREWSWWLDIKILFQTLFVVFKRQNAY